MSNLVSSLPIFSISSEYFVPDTNVFRELILDLLKLFGLSLIWYHLNANKKHLFKTNLSFCIVLKHK